MDAETLYQATYAPGAFDAPADVVYDVANAVGAEYGPILRDDVLDRYAAHSAETATAGAWRAMDAEIAARSERTFGRIAGVLGLPRSDVDKAVAGMLEGSPLMFDRMMADYYGR